MGRLGLECSKLVGGVECRVVEVIQGLVLMLVVVQFVGVCFTVLVEGMERDAAAADAVR